MSINKNKVYKFSSVLALGALAGCSTFNPLDKSAVDLRNNSTKEALEQIQEEVKDQMAQEMWQPYQGFEEVERHTIKGDVTIKASNTPMNILLQGIADKYGYALGFTDKIIPNYPVTVSFSEFTAEDAFRRIGEVAGAAVVIDKQRKQVTFSDVATYSYRIPPNVMSSLKSTFSVGGNTTGNSSAGITGEFKVSGETSNPQESFVEHLKNLAGPTALVSVVKETGMITVRGNAQVLSRTTRFIEDSVQDATTQVAIEASLIEVSLTDGFDRGVNWSKVLSSNGIDYTLNQFAPSLNANQGQFSFFWTNNANLSSIISAIKKFTDVKVVSQPRLLLMNHTPSTLFDGTQVPYLGKLEVTTDGTGQQNTTGEVQFAIDGLSMSVVADVISQENIQITLIPTLNRVDRLETFPLGNSGQLTAPFTTSRQTIMRVISDGKGTLVLGGIRQKGKSRDSAGILPIIAENARSQDSASELVILLRAKAIPSPKYDPLVGEAL